MINIVEIGAGDRTVTWEMPRGFRSQLLPNTGSRNFYKVINSTATFPLFPSTEATGIRLIPSNSKEHTIQLAWASRSSMDALTSHCVKHYLAGFRHGCGAGAALSYRDGVILRPEFRFASRPLKVADVSLLRLSSSKLRKPICSASSSSNAEVSLLFYLLRFGIVD